MIVASILVEFSGNFSQLHNYIFPSRMTTIAHSNLGSRKSPMSPSFPTRTQRLRGRPVPSVLPILLIPRNPWQSYGTLPNLLFINYIPLRLVVRNRLIIPRRLLRSILLSLFTRLRTVTPRGILTMWKPLTVVVTSDGPVPQVLIISPPRVALLNRE